MHRKAFVVFWTIILPILFSAVAYGDDPGIPDTVRVDSVQVDPLPSSTVTFGVQVTLYNDEQINAASLGLYAISDVLTVDSVSLTGGTAENCLDQSLVDNTIGLGVIGFVYMPGIPGVEPVIPGDSLLATIWYTLAAGAEDQTIPIDSGFFPPAGEFILSTSGGLSLTPQFKAGKIVIGEGTPPQPTIGFNPASFTFNGIIGEPDPPTQALNIINVGDGTLIWSVSWSSSWLNVFPTSGMAPANPGIQVDIAGLAAGTYYDTIIITCDNATNSPQYVPVTLNVSEPPPVIELVPDEFYFFALQDSANPESQFMTVNDIGGGTLAWTATNSESWLTLSSYSGGPGDDVELMVDISGLSYGLYYDTIVVSDPEASNSPQYALVTLEILSSFPVLAVDPDQFRVGAYDTANPYDRTLYIINGGGGNLEYKITSSETWLSFSPDSGSTPDVQEVTVSFQSVGQDLGFHYDTIVVTSDNGSESPQTIPVKMWVMTSPPELGISTNQLVFSGYECQNIPPIDSQSFEITNGGVEDLDWTASWDASWLDVDPIFENDAATVWVKVDETDLGIDTYVDTLIIESVWSVTPSPLYVEVIFSVLEYPGSPQLATNIDYMEFIFLAGQVGVSFNPNLEIMNLVSGCMDWYIDSPYPWLEFYPPSSSKPMNINTFVRGGGLPTGITPGQFVVRAPDAVPDSALITFDVFIAQLGDANCDGRINVMDAVHIINYVFAGGPAPIPRIWAGDVNCSYSCNVEDAVYLINFIFGAGPAPCQYTPFF